LLRECGDLARRYLAVTDDTLVEGRADAFARIAEGLAELLHEPFFVWQSGDRSELGKRLNPTNAVLDAVATKAADGLLDAIDQGYGYAAVKADLPADFTSPERRAAVRALLHDALCHGGFDPGPADTGAHDLETAITSAEALLKRILRVLGYRRAARSIFDARDKRLKK
jgi:hypothetical protein